MERTPVKRLPKEPYRFAERDSFEPEIRFESLMLPEIAEMPKLSELPRWIRGPLERIKRITRSR